KGTCYPLSDHRNMGIIKIMVFRIDADPWGNHYIISDFYITRTTYIRIRSDAGVISHLEAFPWFSSIQIGRSDYGKASHSNLISKGYSPSGKTVDFTMVLGNKTFSH